MNSPQPIRSLAQAPLPRWGDAAVAVHRHLLRAGGGALRWLVDGSANTAGWEIGVRIGSASMRLLVAPTAWPQWAPEHVGRDVPPAVIAAGLAHDGAPLWHALATRCAQMVQLVGARWCDDGLSPAADALAWRLDAAGWQGVLQAQDDAQWAVLADHLAAQPAPKPTPRPWSADEIDICLELGRTRLAQTAFARVRRHAVVLLDAPHADGAAARRSNEPLELIVCAGAARTPLARAQWQAPARLVLLEALRAPTAPRRTGFSSSGVAMQNTHSAGAPALDLGDIDVDVRFEIARQRWPLQALAQWRAGEPLALDVPLADATVTAWVHERCIAQGRLVVIGERLGVRLDTLHDGPAPGGTQEASKPAEQPAPVTDR
jgi:flagellar motor switch/type III secretory pathway protein FliN